MSNLLKGKVAVVTGSGRGIGRAHAVALAEHGARVVVNDLGAAMDGTGADKSPADEVVAEIKKRGGEAIASHDSVAESKGAANIIRTAVDGFGRLDILVNNAGIPGECRFVDVTDDFWDMMMKVHLYGHFYCAREAARVFCQQRSGRIINTSSIGGLGTFGEMGSNSYAAAKEGIVGLTRALAHELGGEGITVNCIRPSAATRMTKSKYEDWVSEFGREEANKRRALLEQMAPEGCSGIVVFLASEAADNVNGCVFEVLMGKVCIYYDPPPVEATVWKQGNWTPDELVELLPATLTAGKARVLPAVRPM